MIKKEEKKKISWGRVVPRAGQILTCFIVTTPTQPQLNSKVGFDMKMTLDDHTPLHKLNVINISAVPDPILTKLKR